MSATPIPCQLESHRNRYASGAIGMTNLLPSFRDAPPWAQASDVQSHIKLAISSRPQMRQLAHLQ